MRTLLSYKKYILLFVILGFLAYFPILFNGFVWDDNLLFINKPELHQLGFSVFFDNDYIGNTVYRQIPIIYLASMYSLFGTSAFQYHFIQLIMHILGSFLFFVYLQTFFKKKLSLVLSILFLIHPINTEAVAWISSIQSQFLIIFGISALLLAQNKFLSQKRLYILGILLLLTLMTNENGIYFTILVFVYRYIFKLKQLKNILFLESFILAIYIFLRLFSGAVHTKTFQTTIGVLPLSERLINIPAIILFYIKTLLFPINLFIDQEWIVTKINLTNFIFPLVLVIVLILFYLISILNMYKKDIKNFKIYLFFSIWFFLSMIPLLQIIPIGMTVSERWFYIPFLGLLGMIGTLCMSYKSVVERYQTYIFILLIIVIPLFVYRTFIRSYDWKDEKTLYTHDIKLQPDNLFLNSNVAYYMLADHNYKAAIPYQEKVALLQPDYAGYKSELADSYLQTEQYDKAIKTYKQALVVALKNHDATSIVIYSNLTYSLMKANKAPEALTLLNADVFKKYPNVTNLYIRRAQSEYLVGDYEKSEKDSEFLYKNANSPTVSNLYEAIRSRKMIDLQPD